jgi:GNAT superfamily N-acetyltransferase
MHDRLEMKIVPFAEWRREISPLWMMDGSYRMIPPIINGYGQMQYTGRDIFERVLLYPIAAEFGGERVGWTSIYNISDEALRVRGIYVLPEFRSNGIGWNMVNHAISLWPPSLKRCFMYARSSNVERYKRWGFAIAVDHTTRPWDEGEEQNEQKIVLMQKDLS